MTDKDLEKMKELADALCPYCYRTDYGKNAIIQTPNGVSMCEGMFCEEAYDAWLEEHEEDEPEEVDWRKCYQDWVDGGRK